MTAHEWLTALFWIVAGGYVVYLGWFASTAIRGARRERARRPRHHHPS